MKYKTKKNFSLRTTFQAKIKKFKYSKISTLGFFAFNRHV